jgi:hypothetical protein
MASTCAAAAAAAALLPVVDTAALTKCTRVMHQQHSSHKALLLYTQLLAVQALAGTC